MKLYTEEDVKKAIEIARQCDSDCGGVYFEYEVDYMILEELTPIELPSDEEIIDKALEVGYTNNLFTLGAKWMRDKLTYGGYK